MLGYKWRLSDTIFTKDKGNVFSCFSCGGGSSFGYKLAGFNVIGNNEIDSRMNNVYIENHHPKYNFLEPIQTFKLRKDLPKELYNLIILDGSPPCSSFSISGAREDQWGKEKVFKEGQALQVLDTLFFDFIDLANELKPKIVIAENVKGLLLGNAKSYVRRIFEAFDNAGYYVRHFLINASELGVPQRRERVFFIAIRKDLTSLFSHEEKELFSEYPKLDLFFNEQKVTYGEIFYPCGRYLTEHQYLMWQMKEPSDSSFCDINQRVFGKNKEFNRVFAKHNEVLPTLNSSCEIIDEMFPMQVSTKSLTLASSFPEDYNYLDQKVEYITGMSVPPLMIAKIAERIYNQWVKNRL